MDSKDGATFLLALVILSISFFANQASNKIGIIGSAVKSIQDTTVQSIQDTTISSVSNTNVDQSRIIGPGERTSTLDRRVQASIIPQEFTQINIGGTIVSIKSVGTPSVLTNEIKTKQDLLLQALRG